MPEILKAWVAPWPNDRGRNSGLVVLAMRFANDDHVPHSDADRFPRSRLDRTLEQHVTFGLLDEESLQLLRDAIDRYLVERARGEHE